jgi:hypothetical protein
MPESSLHVRAYDASEWTLYEPDGTPVPPDALSVARAIASGAAIRGERYEVAVGDDREELVLNAEPLLDADGRVHRVVVAFATGDEVERFARVR